MLVNMKEETNKSCVISLVVMVLLIGLFAGGANVQGRFGGFKGCVHWPVSTTNVVEEKPIVMAADQTRCEEVLESIAHAAEVFSVYAGGGGDSMFPTNAFSMSEYMPPGVAKSIDGCYTSAVVPQGGYIFRYSVDLGRTNYLCVAFPASGYTGGVFTIRKDLKVVRNDLENN